MRSCEWCGEALPPRSHGNRTLHTYCKSEKRRLWQREYYWADPEKMRTYFYNKHQEYKEGA